MCPPWCSIWITARRAANWSRALHQAHISSCNVNSPTRARLGDSIEQGKATVGLEIDAGFAQKLRRGQTAPLQVIVDATNSNTALIASGYISQIALGFAQDYQQDRIVRIAPQLIEQMPSVELAPRPWYNPDLSSRWFFVPGIIGSLTWSW